MNHLDTTTLAATAADACSAPARPARRRILGAAAATGAAAAFPRFAIGQAWPSKPIRIIVSTATGGLTDNFARQYGEFISRKFGQPVVVENRTGASGTIGTDVVAKAAPDGHTFLVTISTSVWTARALYRKLPYDPDKELTPVTMFPSGALQMAVHDKVPVKSARGLHRVRAQEQGDVRHLRPRVAAAHDRRRARPHPQGRHRTGALQGRNADVG